jgi:two-component system, NarL family, response regulator NreC
MSGLKRVLLIDEDDLFRQILALVLERSTLLKESLQASSLTATRQVLSNSDHKPDLVIVDLDLTNGGRFELPIGELRVMVPDTPVIGITLKDDAQRRERALRAGADEVLTMTAPPEEIVEAAKRLIGA